jgi:hypothetical protein
VRRALALRFVSAADGRMLGVPGFGLPTMMHRLQAQP